MHKFFSAVNLLAAGTLLLGNALTPQTPAAPTQPAPPAQSTSTPSTSTKAQTPAAKKPATAAKAATPLTLKTQKDKFSYALGMNTGQRMAKGLSQKEVPFDPAILARGLKDGLSGGKTLMTDAEAQAILTQVQTDLRQKQQEKVAENKKDGDAFLAANKAKEGVVTLPSGLQYKILKEGTGPKPTAADTVSCNYRGTFINGTEFDSSYRGGKPVSFPVTGVIKGWTEALQLMPVGSKWQLFIPPDLAYGEQGRPGIEPNSTLVFEVELLSIEEKATEKAPEPAKEPEKK